MTVEIFLRKPEQSDVTKNAEEDDNLPNTLLELEMALKELEWTSRKLKDSTDMLTEEFDKSQGEEAREYYEYIQDNQYILKLKKLRMANIQQKINQLKGVFGPSVTTEDLESQSSGGAGGLFEGHQL